MPTLEQDWENYWRSVHGWRRIALARRIGIKIGFEEAWRRQQFIINHLNGLLREASLTESSPPLE